MGSRRPIGHERPERRRARERGPRVSEQTARAIIPAFTFPATASAVQCCGFVPYLVDVDADTWLLDPERVLAHDALGRVGLVVPVAAFGRPPRQAAWRAFRDATQIPVVIDGAASFDRFVEEPQPELGEIPVAMSFHATKCFSSGEGGAVACTDTETIALTALALNLGVPGHPRELLARYQRKTQRVPGRGRARRARRVVREARRASSRRRPLPQPAFGARAREPSHCDPRHRCHLRVVRVHRRSRSVGSVHRVRRRRPDTQYRGSLGVKIAAIVRPTAPSNASMRIAAKPTLHRHRRWNLLVPRHGLQVRRNRAGSALLRHTQGVHTALERDRRRRRARFGARRRQQVPLLRRRQSLRVRPVTPPPAAASAIVTRCTILRCFARHRDGGCGRRAGRCSRSSPSRSR